METSFYTRESTYLRIRSEVQEALDSDAPILALESSVIAHGLPYPQNLETAQQMEDLVRQEGTTPATIAILGGQIRIGLSHEELAHLATTKGIQKVARRELPVVVAKELDGATTVAGTMYLAQRVGIDVLATGGIGGVHRQHPFDISADLQELARTPVAVVCSGAKAILDLPGTLERLETYGVPVFGYGSDRFPAFYSRDSGRHS
jgi:pseudouridine-5'-phosphate glycosidase